jgi:hypothetical protein
MSNLKYTALQSCCCPLTAKTALPTHDPQIQIPETYLPATDRRLVNPLAAFQHLK